MTEYLFVRFRITSAAEVTTRLNALAAEKWIVVSHCEADGDYSFVLMR